MDGPARQGDARALDSWLQQEPTEANQEVWLAVTHYRQAMTYILNLADDLHFSYDESLIRGLHYMMLAYDLPKNPGKWRPGNVHVQREATGEIVYEGPDAEMVPALMRLLTERLNQKDGTPPLIKAAMAHLNLVMVHPFSDGNGRMARALQTLVLVREEQAVLDRGVRHQRVPDLGAQARDTADDQRAFARAAGFEWDDVGVGRGDVGTFEGGRRAGDLVIFYHGPRGQLRNRPGLFNLHRLGRPGELERP